MLQKLSISTIVLALVMAACSGSATPTPAVPAATEIATETTTEIATEVPTEVPTTASSEAPAAPATAVLSDTVTLTDTDTVTGTVTVTETETTTETETVTETGSVTGSTGMSDTAALADCPVPGDDTQLISSPAAGYCFLIPAGFERSEHSDAEGFHLGIYGPASTPGHRERGFVDVTEAATQTLDVAVQAVVSDVVSAQPDFTPAQSSLTLDGVTAIQIDNLPGQDGNRRIFAVNDGRLYHLMFVPVEESRPDAYAEMEQLYALVIESFRFISATDAASSNAHLLAWEGDIDGACYALTIESSGDAAVGICGDAPSTTTTLSAENMEWVAVQEHFGSIDAETPAGKIVFQGQGSAESEQWAQALATWARFTAMELNAARSSASVRTTLAWQLTKEPEHSGLCSQVIVLAYGYAYANQIPCEGSGQATLVGSGWLSDSELDIFADWVNNGARVESELGYLDAHGSQAITPEMIGNWASGVYTRLLQ